MLYRVFSVIGVLYGCGHWTGAVGGRDNALLWNTNDHLLSPLPRPPSPSISQPLPLSLLLSPETNSTSISAPSQCQALHTDTQTHSQPHTSTYFDAVCGSPSKLVPLSLSLSCIFQWWLLSLSSPGKQRIFVNPGQRKRTGMESRSKTKTHNSEEQATLQILTVNKLWWTIWPITSRVKGHVGCWSLSSSSNICSEIKHKKQRRSNLHQFWGLIRKSLKIPELASGIALPQVLEYLCPVHKCVFTVCAGRSSAGFRVKPEVDTANHTRLPLTPPLSRLSYYSGRRHQHWSLFIRSAWAPSRSEEREGSERTERVSLSRLFGFCLLLLCFWFCSIIQR